MIDIIQSILMPVPGAEPMPGEGAWPATGSILTDDETELLTYVSHGWTSAGLARRLCQSLDTIENKRRKILRKMRANNITEAVAVAIRENIIA
jgi:DNA-binding NarL/FixJ family response regulator